MKLAIAVGALILAATPGVAHAQQKSEAQKVEGVSKEVGVASLVTDCNAYLAKVLRDRDALKLWKLIGEDLTRLSRALDAYSILSDIYDGNYERAAETISVVALEYRLCMLLGPHLCGVYQGSKTSFEVGYAAGEWISSIPVKLGGDRTLNDMWTDVVVDADFQNKKTDAEIQQMIQKMIARHQQKLPALLEKASEPKPPMCSKRDQAKDAVSDMLAKAKADAAATPITSSDSGLSAQTDAAISAGRAGADGAIAAGNAQLISTMQAAQQQALQEQALKSQTFGNQSSTDKPFVHCIEVWTADDEGRATQYPASVLSNCGITNPKSGTKKAAPTAPPPSQQPSCSNSALPEGQVCTGN